MRYFAHSPLLVGMNDFTEKRSFSLKIKAVSQKNKRYNKNG